MTAQDVGTVYKIVYKGQTMLFEDLDQAKSFTDRFQGDGLKPAPDFNAVEMVNVIRSNKDLRVDGFASPGEGGKWFFAQESTSDDDSHAVLTIKGIR